MAENTIIHEISLAGYKATSTGGMLDLGTWGSYGIEKLHLTLDVAWQDLTITAFFNVKGKVVAKKVVGKDGYADVPWEATKESTFAGRIVFEGSMNGQRRITTDLNYKVSNHSEITDIDPVPTDDRWNQFVTENIEAFKAAPANAKAAAASAKEARSWAVGDTASRPGEDTNNAKYYAEQAQQVSQGAVGWYVTPQALQSAHPTGQNGQWAIIGTTDTIWTWDSDTSAWVDSGAQVDLSNYPTNEQLQQALQEYPTTSEVQSMIDSVAPQVMTKEFVITNTITNTYYAEYTQNISVDGYTPVSVGYRCGTADTNVYSCCLRNGMAFVGFTNVKLTNLISGMIVFLVVTYIKT